MRALLKDDTLLSVEEALSLYIKETVPKPIGIEEVNLLSSLNRVSAEDVYSPIDLPPFSRSTVDGFALLSEKTPGEFIIKDKIGIGQFKEIKLSENEAVEVDTGAIIPENTTGVIKIEDTEILENNKVVVNRKLSFGENIGWIGSDIPKGYEILRKGEIITPEKIGLLASVGIDRVKVFKKPKVFIITTGDELIEPGKSLEKGKIYESNAFYLYAKLVQEGYDVIGAIHVKDDKEEIKKNLVEALSRSDVVILTGGTSAGEKDYVHQIIKELGKIIIHGIKFKPGKPTILGIIDGKPVIGLPGNIVSTIMVTERIVLKYLSILYGKDLEEPLKIKAVLMNGVKADKNRYTYLPVYLFRKEKSYYALSVPFDSYMIGTFSSADGYIGLDPGKEYKEGEEVDVYIKRTDPRPIYIGEEEPELMSRLDGFRKIPLGSFPAIKALQYGVGDVVVISKLYENNIKGDYTFKRKIIKNGYSSDIIGYQEWIGLSKLVNSPSIKLRYPTLVKSFIGKATIIAPRTIVKEGKEIGEEELVVICRDQYKPKLKTLFG